MEKDQEGSGNTVNTRAGKTKMARGRRRRRDDEKEEGESGPARMLLVPILFFK